MLLAVLAVLTFLVMVILARPVVLIVMVAASRLAGGRSRVLPPIAISLIIVAALAGLLMASTAAVSASPAMDAQTFNLVVAAAIGAASSYILRWAPASWKGKPMVAVAVVFSIALEATELYVTGQLSTFSIASAADLLMALAGQKLFFDLLKDDLHLEDPPSASAVASATSSPAPPATPPASAGSPH